jgi:hypothetical protein
MRALFGPARVRTPTDRMPTRFCLESKSYCSKEKILKPRRRPLAFLAITEEQLRAGLTQAGLPAEVVNVAISIQASFAAGAFDIVTGDVERLGGRPPQASP